MANVKVCSDCIFARSMCPRMDSTKQIIVRWFRIPSQQGINHRSFFQRDTEVDLYHLLNKMGVVSGGQVASHQILHKNPKRTRQILNQLASEYKIVEHTLLERASGKEKMFKIYTLGELGAKLINAPYKPDYWFEYQTKEVIERIMTAEFYLKFREFIGAEITVEQHTQPYLYRFTQNNKRYLIGVTWDNATTFLEEFRWNTPDDRVILLCQHIKQLDCLLDILRVDVSIRAVPKDKIKSELVFFRPENGRWIIDLPPETLKCSLQQMQEIPKLDAKEKANKRIIRRKQAIL